MSKVLSGTKTVSNASTANPNSSFNTYSNNSASLASNNLIFSTAGVFSFVVPSGVSSIIAKIWGAGGGYGGGSGAYTTVTLNVSAGQVYFVTCGATPTGSPGGNAG